MSYTRVTYAQLQDIKLTDYPYDPDLDVTQLEGIEKLRGIEDRALAALALELLRDFMSPGKRET